MNENGATTTYTPGDDNRYTAVTGASGSTIAHDARGNLTTWDGKTFGYDADNRLVSVSASGLSMTFAYDGDGRLVKLVKNGTVEYRFYDGAQCFLRTDANGTALDWTVWGPTPDEVIARNVSGAWQYYHQDQINSVFAVTNASGTVLERYLYDPFGLPDVRDASWATRTSTTIGNPWMFTGQEWRGDLGLSNYKARWYQPTLGRFLQSDPVRFDAGDINLYRYCGNDPVNRMDPTGMVQWRELGSASLGLVTNGLGVVTGVGLALVPEPTLVTKVAAGVVLTKSGYGFGANLTNFAAALADKAPVSKGALTNDIAQAIAPGNQDAQRVASAVDLATDLAVGKISANAVKESLGPLANKAGFPVAAERAAATDPAQLGKVADTFVAASLVEKVVKEVIDTEKPQKPTEPKK